MRRRRRKPITRTVIQMEMQYFFDNGGEITILPPQIYNPLNRVNCASPYIDYRDNFDDLTYQPAIQI